jgi:amino acid adenylation domain-containing protein/thioester reductase-like protein
MNSSSPDSPSLHGENLSQAKKLLLSKWLGGSARKEMIPRRADATRAPLSFGQQRLWFLEQMAPGFATYNMHDAIRMKARVDTGILQRVFTRIAERHEALRTVFNVIDGEPVQLVLPASEVPLPVVDLRDVEEGEREARARELAYEETRRPFDLVNGPLFRARVLRLRDDEQIILWTLHHIITDGWSSGIIVDEMMALAAAFSAGRPDPLPLPPIQYGDYAAWQRKHFSGEAFAAQIEFWRKELADAPPPLDLGIFKPRPAVPAYAGRRRATRYAPELLERLKKLANREGATLFMVLISAFFLLLRRYSGAGRICVGLPTSNRSRSEMEKLVGYFANTLAICADFDGGASYRQFLAQIRAKLHAAYENQDVPFERLVEELRPKRYLNRTPFFQAMCVLQNEPMPSVADADVKVDPYDVHNGASQFDILFNFIESATGLQAAVEYDSDLVDDDAAERMLEHYGNLLEGIAADPEQIATSIPVMSREEMHRVTVEWNQTAVCYGESAQLPLHKLIEAQVERTPDAYALKAESGRWTYKEMNERANRLAHLLQSHGIGPERLVAVHIERSQELVLALIAVLKAGGAYLPLDPGYPSERLRFMLSDSQASVLLVAGQVPEWARSMEIETVDLSAQLLDDPALSCVNPVSAVNADNLAYVIYTSGSTGAPKGAMNTHRGITNRLLWMQDEYRLHDDRVLQKTPSSFDVSTWEFFWPLLAGAELVVAPPGAHRDSTWLARIIQAEEITTIHFVPSMLKVFLADPAARDCRSLRRVFCSGEALGFDVQNNFHSLLGAELHNLYGPTEAAVDVTYWDCSRNYRGSIVPIGRPIANIQMYVLDPVTQQPLPIGIPGELYIGGTGVGRGYLNREQLTAEKFVPDPFSSNAAARLYRTGDLARFDKDGIIEFLGRIDRQVKLRGFRIELCEIEQELRKSGEIRDAAVILRENSAGDARLVAYIVPRQVSGAPSAVAPGSAERVARLKESLRQTLPEYMVPAQFVEVEELPVSLNGKLDTRLLPAPEDLRQKDGQERIEPGTATEKLLAALWSELLEISLPGLEDDFFDLGGHSLLAAQMVLRLRQNPGKDIPLRSLFQFSNLREMARYIDEFASEEAGDRNAAWPRMQIDSVLPDQIRAEGMASERVAPGATVFLTGATGFLGAFLLEQLLRGEDAAARVLCLVRAPSQEEARGRLAATLRKYQLDGQIDMERVEVVAGDLGLPSFGLSGERFQQLATTVDSIYHCGAAVNFAAPYAQLRAPNVDGTVEVLRLAGLERTKPVHFISTIYTLTAADRLSGPELVESDLPRHGELLRMGYLQSKWVSERLVEAARERGIPVTIYRPGRLCGDTRTGVCQSDDFYWGFVSACLIMGKAPQRDMDENLLPVNSAAQGIVALSRQGGEPNRAYHLINERPLRWQRLFSALGDWGYRVENIPYAEWKEEVVRRVQQQPDSSYTRLAGFLFEEDEEEAGEPPFSAPETWRRLQELEIDLPVVDGQLLEKYFSFFAQSGLFPSSTLCVA